MQCPHCHTEISDEKIRKEAARLAGMKGGAKSKRTDGGGKRCPVHKCFIRKDGTCGRCEKERQKNN